MRLPKPVSDTFTLMHTLDQLWPEAMMEVRWARLKKIAVTLNDIEEMCAPKQLEMFPEMLPISEIDDERRNKLSAAMDKLNQQFGRDSIALGFVPNQVKTFSGTKIAFTRIPDMEEFQE
jgi:DNA polymerase-4